MARNPYGDPTSPQGRAPSLYGSVVVDTVHGKLRIRKWPEKRPGKRAPVNEYWTDWLRQVMALYKYAQPSEVQIWRAAVHGLPVKITDIYTAVMRGTMWNLAGPDGTIYYSARLRERVSNSLDSITQLPGGMLVRGEQLWQGITPAGSSGLVLFTNDTVIPQWGTPEDAGLARSALGRIAQRSTDFAVANNTTTPVAFTSSIGDDTEPPMWDPLLPTRLTMPTDGWYSVGSFFHWEPGPQTEVIHDIRVNGVDYVVSQTGVTQTGLEPDPFVTLGTMLKLEAGDYVEATVIQFAGSTRQIQRGRLWATRVG